MSAQVVLMVAANVFFVTGGLLLGLAFALRFRDRTQQHLARVEHFFNDAERLAA